MQELKATEYDRVLPFLNQVEYDTLFARVVLEKKQRGHVFVDQKRDPGMVLISHHCGMSLLFSIEMNRDFNPPLLEALFTKLNSNPKEQWMIIYPKILEGKWELSLGNRFVRFSEIQFDENASFLEKVAKVQTLSKNHIFGFTRAKFKFDRSVFAGHLNWREKIPPGFILKRIDREVMNRISGEVIPCIFWDTPKDFLKNGVGFCLLFKENIISICFSAFITGNKMELGIETNENYRGQGLGVLTGAALIEYCLENGLEPVWGCEKDSNPSSFNLAQKLGFKEESSYPSYGWTNHSLII